MNASFNSLVLMTLYATAIVSLCRVPTAQGQAAAQDPTINYELRLDEAIRKLDADDVEGARMEYLQALRGVRRDLPKLKLVEGLLQLKIKPPSVPEALAALEEYNKSDDGKNDYRGFAAVGRILKESRRFLLATGPLKLAKGLAPHEPVNGKNVKADIALDLAMAYHGLNRSKLAIDEAKEAEQLAGSDPEIQLRLAEVALGGDDYETARRAVDTAINLFRARMKTAPLDKSNHRSLLSAHQFKINIGIKQAEKEVQNPIPTFDVAVTVQQAGDVQRMLSYIDARETALQALRKEQVDAATTLRIKLFLAKMEASLGAFGEADEHIAEVLREDPENKEAHELQRQMKGENR